MGELTLGLDQFRASTKGNYMHSIDSSYAVSYILYNSYIYNTGHACMHACLHATELFIYLVYIRSGYLAAVTVRVRERVMLGNSFKEYPKLV